MGSLKSSRRFCTFHLGEGSLSFSFCQVLGDLCFKKDCEPLILSIIAKNQLYIISVLVYLSPISVLFQRHFFFLEAS